jgi:hypothetical protein
LVLLLVLTPKPDFTPRCLQEWSSQRPIERAIKLSALFSGGIHAGRSRSRLAKESVYSAASGAAWPQVLTSRCELAAVGLETIAAVDRFVAAWHKWHEGFLAALATGRRVHFPLTSNFAAETGLTTSALSRRFARRTAVLAPGRLVRKAFLGVKLLFAGGKREGSVAVDTGQTLVGIHRDL